MPLVAKAPPIIRMQYDQPGDGDDNVLEAYADIDAYRGLWYARGWRSPVDDPEFVGEVEPEPEDPWRGPAGPIANGAGTLALRPVVGDVATGFSYWASDDDGGQRWVKSGGVWVKDGPSNNDIGGEFLGGVAPTSDQTVTCTAANTDYRMIGFTTGNITVPNKRMRVVVGLTRLFNTGNSLSCRPTLKYTKDGWATAHPLVGPVGARGDYVSYSPFYFFNYELPTAMLPPPAASGGAALAAGNTIQIGLFVQHATAGIVITLGSNGAAGAGLSPFIEAQALAS